MKSSEHNRRQFISRGVQSVALAASAGVLLTHSNKAHAVAIVDDIIAGISSGLSKGFEDFFDKISEAVKDDQKDINEKQALATAKAGDAEIEFQRYIDSKDLFRLTTPLIGAECASIDAAKERQARNEYLKRVNSQRHPSTEFTLKENTIGRGTANLLGVTPTSEQTPINEQVINNERIKGNVNLVASAVSSSLSYDGDNLNQATLSAFLSMTQSQRETLTYALKKRLNEGKGTDNPAKRDLNLSMLKEYCKRSVIDFVQVEVIGTTDENSPNTLKQDSIRKIKIEGIDDTFNESIENATNEVAVSLEYFRAVTEELELLNEEFRINELQIALLASRLT